MSKGKKILISIVCVVLLLGLGAMMFYFHQGLWLPRLGDKYTTALHPKNEQELEILMGSEFLYSQTGKCFNIQVGSPSGKNLYNKKDKIEYMAELDYAQWGDIFENNFINASIYKKYEGRFRYDHVLEEAAVNEAATLAGRAGNKLFFDNIAGDDLKRFQFLYMDGNSLRRVEICYFGDDYPKKDFNATFAACFVTIENYIAQLV